jgi:hypothetical protein
MAEDSNELEGLREVPASEILAKIEKGEPVEYDHVIIKDALDIRKLDSIRYDKIFLIKSPIEITNSIFNENVDFTLTVFKEDFVFSGSQLIGFASFTRAYFTKSALFSAVHFRKTAEFTDTQFKGYTSFGSAEFNWNAYFNNALFGRKSYFSNVLFIGDASFGKSTFNGSTQFIETEFKGVAYFSNALFNGDTWFWKAQFSGDAFTFKDARFKYPRDQEDAYRRAKNVLEKNGNREEAGYHFYREMEAKRRQKPWYVRYPEFFFIQLIFGYGVHPFRLMFCWFAIATIFAFIYLAKGGIISKLPASSLPQPLSYFVECFYFSIVTAVTPGYGKYELTSWVYQVIASVEAILGTFMWAAFIATFARKYMR